MKKTAHQIAFSVLNKVSAAEAAGSSTPALDKFLQNRFVIEEQARQARPWALGGAGVGALGGGLLAHTLGGRGWALVSPALLGALLGAQGAGTTAFQTYAPEAQAVAQRKLQEWHESPQQEVVIGGFKPGITTPEKLEKLLRRDVWHHKTLPRVHAGGLYGTLAGAIAVPALVAAAALKSPELGRRIAREAPDLSLSGVIGQGVGSLTGFLGGRSKKSPEVDEDVKGLLKEIYQPDSNIKLTQGVLAL